MTNLRCQDYGYKCDYIVEGETNSVINGYKEHMNDVHGIDYSTESVLQFVKRKKEDI